MKRILSIIVALLVHNLGYAQGIAINDDGSSANTLSILDINTSAKTKGILLPRVTTAQMNAITGTTSQGLTVYNTTENLFYYNKSTTATANWVPVLSSTASTSSGIGGWALTGNAGTNATSNFLGTADAQDLVFKTGGSAAGNQRLRITSAGNVGIGTITNPSIQLVLDGTGDVFGVENTGTFRARNSGGTWQNYFWPRWSDNIMYANYGANGFVIRNNASVMTMYLTSINTIGINSWGTGDRLDVDGNIVASGTTGGVYNTVYWGANGSRTEWRDDAGLQGNAGARSGFFETSNPSPAANWPPGASSWWHLLDVRHQNPANNYTMQFAGSFYDQELYFRKTNGNAAQSWSQALTWNRRKTIPFAGTTEFYSDEYVLLRWSGSRLQISARSGQAGTWAVYSESEEHTSTGIQLPHTMATSVSAVVGSWVNIGSPGVAQQNASGLTYYLSRDNASNFPVYYIEAIIHGNKVTFIVQRVNP
jgi:hypothetical protein